MKIQKQSAIDYLRKRGYKTGYKEPYSITENGLVEFMRDFAQEQINLLTQKNELVKADVSRSLFLELAVRTNRTMPEREEELAWFDEGTDFKKCGDFHDRFFKEIARIRNDG